jgi:hypothetical protein
VEAARSLAERGISAEIIDLRSACPLDAEAVTASARKTGRVLVVDEDYFAYGLSGEVAAVLAEAGVKADFARLCTREVVPYDRRREDETLPNVRSVTEAAQRHCEGPPRSPRLMPRGRGVNSWFRRRQIPAIKGRAGRRPRRGPCTTLAWTGDLSVRGRSRLPWPVGIYRRPGE